MLDAGANLNILLYRGDRSSIKPHQFPPTEPKGDPRPVTQ